MLIAAKYVAERWCSAGRDRGGEKTLLRTAMPRERVLGPLVRDAAILHGVHERFEHGGLHLGVLGAIRDVGAAHEYAIAAGRNNSVDPNGKPQIARTCCSN